jgi:hypothetical protein
MPLGAGLSKPAAPGGCIKGYVNIEAQLSGKWIEILDTGDTSVIFPVFAAFCVGSRFRRVSSDGSS